jgi:hypothetical protein
MSAFMNQLLGDEPSPFHGATAAGADADGWAAAAPQAAVAAPAGPPVTRGPVADMAASIREAVEHTKDTMAASEELKGKFEVLKPGEAPTKPNQVSEAQYKKLCETYSDIRRGKTNFQLDTSGMDDADAASSKKSTMDTLGKIMQTGAGRELLEHMAYTKDEHGEGRPVRIRADMDALTPTTTDDSKLQDDPRKYNGQGLGSKIIFNPYAIPAAPDSSDKETWLKSMRPDVALFHELLHAQHFQDGDTAAGEAEEGLDVVHTSAGDVGAAKAAEEQVVGIGGYETELWTENDYRAERRLLGENADPRDSYTTASEREKVKNYIEGPSK